MDFTLHRPARIRLDVYPFLLLEVLLATFIYLTNAQRSETLKVAWGFILIFLLVMHGCFLVATFWSASMFRLARLSSPLKKITPQDLQAIPGSLFVCTRPDVNSLSMPIIVTPYRFQPTNSLRFEYEKLVFEIRFGPDDDLTIPSRASPLAYPTPQEALKRLQSRGDGDFKVSGFQGLSSSEHASAVAYYGRNEFNVPLPLVSTLLLEQALSPLFLFQIFCVTLWLFDDYWYMALFTLVMLVLFEFINAKNRLNHSETTRAMLRAPHAVFVIRDHKKMLVYSNSLVPGDLLMVSSTEENAFPCDALVLNGKCVVNEAMLTGETTPKFKSGANDVTADLSNADSRHLILGGTFVLQTSEPVAAVVLRTGFGTVQGSLVRTIMSSRERITAGSNEAYLFMAILLLVASVASGYVLHEGLKDGERSRSKLLLHAIMVLTSVVPPELPMELSLAVTASLARLVKQHVYCTEAYRIPLAGTLDVCCFDKTGTLTSDLVTVFGVFSSEDSIHPIPVVALSPSTMLILTKCNEIVYIDGKPMGDPLEVATLRFTAAATAAMMAADTIRVHPFSAEKRRMSVLVSTAGNNIELLCKGAPETMRGLLKTIPPGYDATMKNLTKRGFRVLCIANRALRPGEILQLTTREKAECELDFCGFLALESPMKYDTAACLEELQKSGHAIAIITGDNAATTCEVARRLNILRKDEDESSDRVVIGDDPTTAALLASGQAVDVCVRGRVFARMSPKQKETVLKTLKTTGMCTLMCGDGTNDVGALKMADVGVSVVSCPALEMDGEDSALSHGGGDDAFMLKLGDASVASPFTSRSPSISAVLDIVRQGRCTLVTTVQMYKILAVNGLQHSWAMTVLFLRGVKTGDLQSTMAGLAVAGCFALLSFTQPMQDISHRRPVRHIFSAAVLVSIAWQAALHLLLLVRVTNMVEEDECVAPDSDFAPNLVNTLVFEFGLAVQAVIFATNYRGQPFMVSLLDNKALSRMLGGLWITAVVFAAGVMPESAYEYFGLVKLPDDMVSDFIGVVVMDAVLAIVFEIVVVRGLLGG